MQQRRSSTIWAPTDKKLNHLFETHECEAGHSTWMPNTDVYESEDMLVVRMELSGINREDLQIMLRDRLLVVRGVRNDPPRLHKSAFRQMEIEYGPFERRILLPRSVDSQAARAHFNNGFLHINLPKVTHSQHTTVTVILEKD